MNSDCITAAITYGWPLIKLSKPGDPGPSPGKRPVGRNWETRPGMTADEARAALDDGYNIGIRTGGRLLVVDCDGERPDNLPETPTCRTGSGGRHLYYRVPEGTTLRVGCTTRWIHPSTDTRGDGGQVVAPGSIHAETGALYEWETGLSPLEVPLAVLPQWVIDAINRREAPPWKQPAAKPATLPMRPRVNHEVPYIAVGLAKAIANVANAPEGQRNETLNREAFSLAGLPDVDPMDHLLGPAMQAGLSEAEARATIASGTRAGRERPRTIPDPQPAALPTAGSGAVVPFVKPEAGPDLFVVAAKPRHLAVKFHGLNPNLRYWRGDWYRYTGTHYAVVQPTELHRDLSNVAATWHYYDVKTGQPIGVADSLNESLINSTIAQLRGLAMIAESVDQPCWLDTDPPRPAPEWLAMRNCLLSLVPNRDTDPPTRAVLSHTPTLFTTMALPFNYAPDADSPEVWIDFLARTWPGESGIDAANLLAEWFGYVLSSDMKYHKLFWLIGPPRSGKGIISRVLSALVGPDVTCAPTLSSIGDRNGGQVLIGKRLAVIGDARLDKRRPDNSLITERLLSISGGDTQTFPRKYLPDWTGSPEVKIVILSNELPPLTDESGALLGRLLLLNTTKSHLGKEDHFLEARIRRELPGILNWALAGLERLNTNNRFTEPESSREIIALFRGISTPLSAFVAECCEVDEGATVERGALYAAYLRWAEEEGITRPYSKNRFGIALRSIVPALGEERPRSYGARMRYYSGIRLQ